MVYFKVSLKNFVNKSKIELEAFKEPRIIRHYIQHMCTLSASYYPKKKRKFGSPSLIIIVLLVFNLVSLN